ncbi:ribonuclease H2 subunit A [Brevipalpus obovatus]|uniref:ribonuclease H2 subunit A n=1 Tax=Brevipalpus obovatus TaxID=246614 RepID=UPI003D9E39C0
MSIDLSPFIDDCNHNHLFEAKVDSKKFIEPCILGIDEAGRGPVLGPMLYAVAFYPEHLDKVMKKHHFADSKSLTEERREEIFEKIESDQIDNFGWMAWAISPTFINNSMLKRRKYNLNTLSHDFAMDLIKLVIEKEVNVKKVFLDTVGPPEKYKEKLERKFPDIEFVVSKKADSLYTVVSAASICAKVIRDRIVSNWKFREGDINGDGYGSGYPSDPKTKKFLDKNLDSIFGFPSITRFSWATVSTILDDKAVGCRWKEQPGDDDEPKNGKKPVKTSKEQPVISFEKEDQHIFLRSRNLRRITDFSKI